MKKLFTWTHKPNIETANEIEKIILAVIEEKNIIPCHNDTLNINLNFTDPLDCVLNGVILCDCNFKILSFKSHDNANSLEIFDFKI